MKRRWKILIGLAVALVVLLAVNTVIVNQQTKGAEVNAEGGEILELPGGDVQVTNLEAKSSTPGAPIVLIHCYSCSLKWWDPMQPLLNQNHRVVRIDLLGHGGSEKPSSGYSIEEQAQLVAAALSHEDVQGAVVVGHSLGATVATALAVQSSQLVDRVVNIDRAPDNSYGSLPFLATLGSTPVIGQAMWRTTPDFAIRSGFEDAFAPDFDMEDAFENPDQVVDDYNAMTYTSFDEASAAAKDYTDEIPLDERFKSALVPLLVIFGEEDQIYDAGPASEAFREVPGARVALIPGAGHSPNVEKPEETANLILEFAADAGDEISKPPRNVGLDRKKGGGRKPGAGKKQGANRGKGSNGGNQGNNAKANRDGKRSKRDGRG